MTSSDDALRPPSGGGYSPGSDDLLEFAREFSSLTAAGLPPSPGLRALAAELPGGTLARRLTRTADRLDLGLSPADAAADSESGLPAYLRGLMLVGMRTDRLAEILAQFVRFRSAARDALRRYLLLASYPIFLLATTGILIVFTLEFVVLPFETIYRDFGVDLPHATRVILAGAHLAREYGAGFVGGLLLSSILLAAGARIFLSPADRRALMQSIPVIGPVLRYGGLAEFCRLLGTLVESRVPLPEALGLASAASSDASLTRAGERVREEIERGRSFGESLRVWRDCPSGLIEMLVWAEKHRNLSESLHLAGEMYEAQSRSRGGFAAAAIGTSTLLLVIVLIGITIAGTYLPMIQLISRLSG
ncbi:MAG: type II secretion system F family protein [Isosphaeraceae bacterium]|nr:type II secretion system F family protein [Isosphaeraceae bacterium]